MQHSNNKFKSFNEQKEQDVYNSTNKTVPEKSQEPEKINQVWEVIKFFLLAAMIVIPIRMFIAQPFIVSGASMDPTLASNQYLIVDQLSYRFEDPKRGDVIILKYPKNTSKYFVKRIIGLPGETVTIVDGVVTITEADNTSIILDEPYILDSYKKLNENLVEELSNVEYFVMGDNRKGSLDSRSWGPLNERFIVGRTLIRLFPLSKIEVNPGQNHFRIE